MQQEENFKVTAIRPGGWPAFLHRILPASHEVEEVRMAIVRTAAPGGIAVLAVYLSVYTPVERLRALRLELERLLPSRLPIQILFSRKGAAGSSRLAALLAGQGAVLYRRSDSITGVRVRRRLRGQFRTRSRGEAAARRLAG